MHLKGHPFVEGHPELYVGHLNVGDDVTGQLITFPRIDKFWNIVHILINTKHNGFAIIDEPLS